MRKKQHSPDFMVKVGWEALKGVKTMSEFSSKYEVHASVISRWRKRALAGIIEGFYRDSKQTLGIGKYMIRELDGVVRHLHLSILFLRHSL